MWKPMGLAALLLAGVSGCEEQELQALRKVGDLTVSKVSGLIQDAKGRVQLPMTETPPPARINIATPGLAERVRSRLQWDRHLSSLSIQVQLDGTHARLQGQVTSDEQRRRAVSLAESTAGIDGVVDELRLAP